MTTSHRWSRSIAIAATLLVVVGCGGTDDDEVSSTTVRPVSSTSSTTTAPSPACDDVSIPNGATRQTEATADVDGDGTPDALRTFLVSGSDWHLQVLLAAGGGADLSIVTFDPAAVAVLGGADLDGDGAEEIWARTGSGASATILGLIRYADCALTRVTFETGEVAELAVGGSVGTASGVECGTTTDPSVAVIAHTASNTGDDEYQVTSITYALDGSSLRQAGSSEATVSTRDPRFELATSFSCGDLRL